MKPAEEIKRLHEEVVRQTRGSRKCLHAALVAAWQAGRLLLKEKERVRKTMGAAWMQWVKEKFPGSPSTAQNYMRLAESIADLSEFEGLSLRQIYLLLGIATEPKCRRDSPQEKPMPPHLRLANRLIVALRQYKKTLKGKPELSILLRQDMRMLYELLRQLIEVDAAANLPGQTILSSKVP